MSVTFQHQHIIKVLCATYMQMNTSKEKVKQMRFLTNEIITYTYM